jgi:diguanylate cyclase (GGDEF)-like protein
MKRRAAVIAGASTLLGSLLVQALLCASGSPVPWVAWSVASAVATGAAAAVAALAMHLAVSRRIHVIARFLEEQRESGDALRRLPELGSDQVGKIAEAANDLVASMTSLEVDVIDHRRELAVTQGELRLKGELEQRLRERALLFEILRVSAAENDFPAMLDRLTERLGAELGLREVSILLREGEGDEERFVVRTAVGFRSRDSVVGRSIRRGEGLAGVVAERREPIIVADVRTDPQYLSFWGAAPREGGFAAFPILGRTEMRGLLAMTRPADRPFSELEVAFLRAITDTLALAIRRAQLLDELRELSTHDELTGLANRRLLGDRLGREIGRARRFGHPLSVLAVDIDHFKMLNDRCGHPTGDEALVKVARVMERSLRSLDTVARIGGEEFVVILSRAASRDAARLAETLRENIAGRPMPGGDGQPGGSLTVSVGVAELLPSDDAGSLLSRADEALYAAKQAGRNRVHVHAGDRQLVLHHAS